jgi:hypothetical protein
MEILESYSGREERETVGQNRRHGTSRMNLHPNPLYQSITVKALIPRSLGTRSQQISRWIPSDRPAATVCMTNAGYQLKEAEIRPTQQIYRVLTGQERKKHFGLITPMSRAT